MIVLKLDLLPEVSEEKARPLLAAKLFENAKFM